MSCPAEAPRTHRAAWRRSGNARRRRRGTPHGCRGPARVPFRGMNPALIEAPDALRALEPLLDRFRHEDMDVPGGQARIRLEVTDGDDLRRRHRGRRAAPRARPRPRRPDAPARAPTPPPGPESPTTCAAGWTPSARGRLRVRENLHLGVGLLAATSGSDEPGGCASAGSRPPTTTSSLARGRGGPAADLPARARRHQGLLPDDGQRARAARASRDRDRPARLRRLRQAALGPLRRALVRRGRRRAARRARPRAGQLRRQQHGRADRDRARHDAIPSGSTSSSCSPRRSPGSRSGPGSGCCRCRCRASATCSRRRAGRSSRSSAGSSRAASRAGPPPASTSSCAPT